MGSKRNRAANAHWQTYQNEDKGIFQTVDDYTRLVWARAISTKDAALDAFQYYRTHAEKFHSAAGHKLQVMRSDNSGEFISGRFTAYLEQAGISSC